MSLKYDYTKKVVEMFEKIEESQKDKIEKVIEMFVENIKNDQIIHVFGTGHSQLTGLEIFARAGGLANVNLILDSMMSLENGARRASALEKRENLAEIIYDSYTIEKGDIMIITSNSGRNPMPIEMALKAKDNGVKTIALTNVEQSKKAKSRHKSNKNLYEVVDVVVDTCVPFGDSLMEVSGSKTAPGSSMSTMLILNIIVSEVVKRFAKENKKLPIFQSQNVDGYDNDGIYKKYENRIKHF